MQWRKSKYDNQTTNPKQLTYIQRWHRWRPRHIIIAELITSFSDSSNFSQRISVKALTYRHLLATSHDLQKKVATQHSLTCKLLQTQNPLYLLSNKAVNMCSIHQLILDMCSFSVDSSINLKFYKNKKSFFFPWH